MKIISISGLDGSGKSTQSKMLQEFLEKNNKKVYYFHAIQYSFPQALKRFLHLEKAQSDEKSGKIQTGEKPGVTKASSLAIFLRKVAFIIDVLRFHFLKKKLAKREYDYMVTDRYFYDTIINISYLEKRNTPSRLEKYLPLADASFYLKIQPEAIMTRPRVPEQGLQYLKDKKKLYDMFGTLWSFQSIDASLPPEKLFEKILQQLKQL